MRTRSARTRTRRRRRSRRRRRHVRRRTRRRRRGRARRRSCELVADVVDAIFDDGATASVGGGQFATTSAAVSMAARRAHPSTRRPSRRLRECERPSRSGRRPAADAVFVPASAPASTGSYDRRRAECRASSALLCARPVRLRSRSPASMSSSAVSPAGSPSPRNRPAVGPVAAERVGGEHDRGAVPRRLLGGEVLAGLVEALAVEVHAGPVRAVVVAEELHPGEQRRAPLVRGRSRRAPSRARTSRRR